MALKAKPGDIIRNRKTRDPYLVIDKTTTGYSVINLFEKVDPAPVFAIVARAYDAFEPDVEIVDMTQSEAERLEEKLDIVESVQDTLFTEEV